MLLENLVILSMVGDEPPRAASIRISEQGRLDEIGELARRDGEEVVAMDGLVAVPGFVQGHVHLCQTLFRNLAEDRPLLDWLRDRIWPLEAAHDEASLRASTRLGLLELARGGCTTFQSMETVHGTEFVFEEVARSRLRGILGNALMDAGDAPAELRTTTREALELSAELRERWDGVGDRLFYAYSPRFVLSCSDDLHHEIARLRRDEQCRVHTHAAEHPSEVDAVVAARGSRYLAVLDDLGLLGERTSLAHCVHLDEDERRVLSDRGASVLHCPSTNLKLGSGIAPIVEYRRRGIPVGLGSDGAPANNRLDVLTEVRLAALLQQLRAAPGAFTARDALALATREGAAALGLSDSCGTLESGKSADLVVFDLTDPCLGPGGDDYEKIVWSAGRSHIRHVIAGGSFVVRDGFVEMNDLDEVAVTLDAERQLDALLSRASLAR